MARDDQVQVLLDKQAITELSYRYSRAADRLDRELLASVYWPDGTDDHGAFVGSAPDYVDWVMTLLSGWISVHHDNTNILIDLDGDTATGELRESTLPLRTVGGILQVPVTDLVELRTPSPTVPESLRTRITELLADLGNADYNRREAATKELQSLGAVVKEQGADALKATTDPEVRKRLQTLLDGLKE